MRFREKPVNRLYAFALAAVFAVALAGCGGGGGSAGNGDDDAMTTPEPTETQKLAAAKTAAMTAYEAAKTALAAVMDDASHDMDSYGKAEEALGEAKAANAVAQAATTSAAAEDAQAIVEAARDNAVMYAGMVTAAATKAAERVGQEAKNKEAGTKETAIAAEAAQTTDAGLGGDAGLGADGVPGGGDDTYSLSISRDRMGTKVTVTVEGATDADDEKFMQAMDLGGGLTMHTRAMAADDDGNVMEEVVMVRTDIEAPTAVAFAMVAGQALNARDLDATEDADGDGNAANDFTALTIAAGNLPKIMSPAFAAATGDTVTHTFDFDDPETDEDEADEVAGTYNGAMGTYRCDGDVDCTVTLDGDGEVTAIGAGWVFTPDEGATSDVPDADHLHYGFWLKKTTDADGAVTYNEVETFAGSSVAASGDVTAVSGSATYEGGAVGVYVKNVYKPDRTLDMATSGHFTADVSLTATFDQLDNAAGIGTIAPSLLNTVSGTIGNFMLSGGEENEWSVALQGAITPGDGTASGTAKGGEGDGSFSATFHGSVTAAADGTVPRPGSVVGEFNAGFTDGSVAGAFGARKTDD